MKNIIKLIINFFKKLFGIKTEENKPQTVPSEDENKPSETSSGDVVDSGSTEENNGSECQCNCSGLTIGSAPSAWGCSETSSKCVSYTADTCLTDLNISVTGANSDKFAASLDTSNSQICVAPVGTNVSQNAYTATVTLSYKANGTSCDAKTFTVTQNSGSECQCKIVIIEDDTDGCKGGKVIFGIM